MTKAYSKLAKRLRQTGGGVQDDETGDQSERSQFQVLDFYIDADGPDENTPFEAVNLWGT